MLIDTDSRNNGVILRLSGKVIGDSVSQLKQIIEERLSSGVKWIIIDLAEVPMMDSSALGTVIAAFLKLREKNGRLALLNAQKSILNVLAITKLDSLFKVYDDIQVALDSVVDPNGADDNGKK